VPGIAEEGTGGVVDVPDLSVKVVQKDRIRRQFNEARELSLDLVVGVLALPNLRRRFRTKIAAHTSSTEVAVTASACVLRRSLQR
jgi:hypothetical protein